MSATISSTPSPAGCATATVPESSTEPVPTASAAALAVDCALVTEILTGFVREEVRKVGFERAVVGLSGGIDSALALAVVCRGLGVENAIPVIMPYRASSPASERDARLVAAQLGATPLVVDISPQIDAYFESCPDADRNRRGNKMARERMSILYDISLARSALVVGTSNKTELLLGYGTIHGDMAHALNPLGDLYKTQVFALARHLGLPAAVIAKAPSADLWEGQSDEDELGFEYAAVDLLLHHMVDERRTRVELRALGFADAFVDQIRRRVRDSQYKRRPPLIAKLSNRTIDRDFRYPRDWGR
jgi:NAD+ synthase